MLSRFRKLSLENQLLISFFALSAFLLTLSLSITFFVSTKRQRQEIDQSLSDTASYIASLDQVSHMLKLGYPTAEAIRELDSIYNSFSNLNVIDIYDTNGLRFYHTDRQQTGETLLNGEELAILNGSEPYITTGIGTLGAQRRAFHAIKAEDGTIIGFITASVFSTYISDQAMTLFPVYVLILFLMLSASIMLTNLIVRLLHASLMGHHPEELLDLYLKQDSFLNAMDESIIASDKSGNIIFMNQSAARLFPELQKKAADNISLRTIEELFPDSSAAGILKNGYSVSHRTCQLAGKPLICSELPIGDLPNIQGVLTILIDRSEIERLSDELSGARSMLNTLRAFNHEFLNKLHVILGYLQTGETEKAITFITNSTHVSSQAIRQTADRLRVSQICALVIGKMMHAAELGIRLSVTPDSRCMSKNLLLPLESYITIIGNLLENAIEELSACHKELLEVILGIYMTEDCTIITCEDTGRGIPKELLADIFKNGVSSKGENRGTGLFLIHQLIDVYHGSVTIDTEENEGTLITITFTRKEKI